MKITSELIETWKKSIIEIKVSDRWVTIWNGANFYVNNLPPDLNEKLMYVITAYNPGSEQRSEQENLDADRQLRARLEGIPFANWVESVGRSLSGSHTEYGCAVYGIDKEVADNLSEEFGQIGYYCFSNSGMSIYVKNKEDGFIPI